nr:hypothetical protein CFP56_07182 [Quercus suber]
MDAIGLVPSAQECRLETAGKMIDDWTEWSQKFDNLNMFDLRRMSFDHVGVWAVSARSDFSCSILSGFQEWQ